MKLETVLGQPSYAVASTGVQTWITARGAHLSPVRFRVGDRWVEPLHVAPWAEEPDSSLAPILQVLRGDFLCVPFGANEATFQGEKHPIHGESANESWSLAESEPGRIRLELESSIRPGRFSREITVRDGEAAVVQTHEIAIDGPMNFGMHAMVSFHSPGRISTSRVRFAQVFPGEFEDATHGGYSSLVPGARFDSLGAVPSRIHGTADLTRYPAREGYEDLVLVAHRDSDDFAWVAVAFPDEGYVWVSLKDPRQLPSTVFWHSNGGRHYKPWLGRHRGVLGIEEVCAYFHYGIAESVASNPVQEAGIPTFATIRADDPIRFSTVMVVAAIPAGFESVLSVDRTEHGVILRSEDGAEVSLPVTFPKEWR
jgi:hypothetical protein